MLAGMSFGTDLKRYSSGVLPRIALVTIILMPLLYGAMYLWAFWNPFGAIDKMPVALVNADKGCRRGRQAGARRDRVASSLLDSGQLLLREVSEQDAAKGSPTAGTTSPSPSVRVQPGRHLTVRRRSDPGQAAVRVQRRQQLSGTIIGQNAAREVINQVNAGISERAWAPC